MSKNCLDSEIYHKILEKNQINYRCCYVFDYVNYKSFEDKENLLDYLLLDPAFYEDEEEIRKYGEAIDYCLAKGWIKWLSVEDIEFDQVYFNDDLPQISSPYLENEIGLSYEGAIMFNNFELQIDEAYGRRYYEKVVREAHTEEHLILQGLYIDVVQNMLNRRMHGIYVSHKNQGERVEITYVEPFEIKQWYPRRYIKLDKGYRAEISYKML